MVDFVTLLMFISFNLFATKMLEFGAAFNVLGSIDLTFFLDYIMQALLGGIICLMFKVIGDILSPLWVKHKQNVRDFVREKKIRIRKRKRHDQD